MHRTLTTLAVALAACGGPLEDDAPQSLSQGLGTVVLAAGFESPVTSSALYQPVTGATLYVAAGVQGAQFEAGGWVPAPQGVQQGFLQSSGSIERTVALVGSSQTLTFKARRSTQLGGSLTAPFQVFLGATLVGSVVPTTTAFQTFSIVTTGTGNRTLSFVNPAGAAKTLVDDVKLTANSGAVLLEETFEAPSAGGGFVYQPTSSDFVYAGAGVQRSAYVNGGWLLAPVGQQFGFFQSGASMRRVVPFTAGTHALSMKVARSPQLGGSMTLPLQVYVDSTLIGSFTFSNTTFTTVTIPAFSVGAGNRVVRFVNASGAALTFIDDVQLTR